MATTATQRLARTLALGLLGLSASNCGTVKAARPLGSTIGTQQQPNPSGPSATGPSGPGPSNGSGPGGPQPFFVALDKGPAEQPFVIEFAGYTTGERGSDGRPIYRPMPAPTSETPTKNVYEIPAPASPGTEPFLGIVFGCASNLGSAGPKASNTKNGVWAQVSRAIGEAELRCTEAEGVTLNGTPRPLTLDVAPGAGRMSGIGAASTSDAQRVDCPSGLCPDPTRINLSATTLPFDLLLIGESGARREFKVLRDQLSDSVVASMDGSASSKLSTVTIYTGGRTSAPSGALLNRFATALGATWNPIDERASADLADPTYLEWNNVISLPASVLAVGDSHRVQATVTGDNRQQWVLSETITGTLPDALALELVDAPMVQAERRNTMGRDGWRISGISRANELWTVVTTEYWKKILPGQFIRWNVQLDPSAQANPNLSLDLNDVTSVPGFVDTFLYPTDVSFTAKVKQHHIQRSDTRTYEVDASQTLSVPVAL